MKKSRYVLTILLIVAFRQSIAEPSDPTIVQLDTGRVRGVSEGGVLAFKGIPFAQAPIGVLRWHAPEPVKRWQGIRDAVKYGADCMQLPLPGDAAPLGVTPSEDCLYLNVWKPATTPAKKLPVMVWIYGGGFVNGGSSPAVYDGRQLATRGVVVVSLNYRLGRFGFFAHPALTQEAGAAPQGNFAFLDQLAALKWVKRNAAVLGGDPGNVTVFGESAGGVSVHVLMTSSMARGLFNKAIIESGAGRSGLGAMLPIHATNPNTPSAEKAGLLFARSVGVTGTDAAALHALRQLSAETIRGDLNMATMGAPTYSGPMIDGQVVTQEPADAYERGVIARVPVIVGATGDDGFFFGGTLDQILAPFGAARAQAQALLDPDHTGDVAVIGKRAFGDRVMIEPARFIARSLERAGIPVFAYRFSYVADSMRKEWQRGAPHASEIPYVFDTIRARYGAAITPQDENVAKAVQAYWVAFANTGNPNADGLPKWPSYDAKADVIMDFTSAGSAAAVPDALRARLDLAESLSK